MVSHYDRLTEAILMSSHNITIFNIHVYIRKSALIIPYLQLLAFFKGTQEQVRNSHGKRAISVRATEVLLYMLHMYMSRIALYIDAIHL